MAYADATLTEWRDAVFGAFDTYFTTLHSDVPIAWANKPFDPKTLGIADTDAWVLVSLLGSAGGDISIGSGFSQREGVLTVQIYTRGQASSNRLYSIAEGILQFMATDGQNIGIDGLLRNQRFVESGFDGTWFLGTATCDYVYFTNRAA
jgi:hypothetical protein